MTLVVRKMFSNTPTTPASTSSFVPVNIAAGDTYTVPANCQVLFALPIEVDGFLIVNGFLIEVD